MIGPNYHPIKLLGVECHIDELLLALSLALFLFLPLLLDFLADNVLGLTRAFFWHNNLEFILAFAVIRELAWGQKLSGGRVGLLVNGLLLLSFF